MNIFLFEQSGEELDQELERAKKEEAELMKLLRQREAEVQRLKHTKTNNRKDMARRKKERRQKISQLTWVSNLFIEFFVKYLYHEF